MSEHSGYHHGEMSLNETIIGMAQDFVGSNNVAWLVPKGQFGTRLEGGKDSAASRYIFTYLQPYIKHLVPQDDLGVLKYRDDDGLSVEPEWYAPVLPMLLVNGCRGIGTGYSTFVPCYNPTTLKDALQAWLLAGGDTADMSKLETCNLVPWYRGFTGRIEAVGADYVMTATYEYNASKKTVRVTDLPVGYWTSQFKQMLDAFCEKKEVVKDYTDTSTDTDVNFEIVLYDALTVEVLEKTLGLTEKLKTTNMHAFDPSGTIKKYTTPNEILIDYARCRLDLYGKRKEHLLSDLRAKLPWHSSVVKFLTLMCEDAIDLRKKSAGQCHEILTSHGLECIDNLLKLPFSSITAEHIAKHQAELDALNKKIAQIERTTPNEFWLEDLCGLKV